MANICCIRGKKVCDGSVPSSMKKNVLDRKHSLSVVIYKFKQKKTGKNIKSKMEKGKKGKT